MSNKKLILLPHTETQPTNQNYTVLQFNSPLFVWRQIITQVISRLFTQRGLGSMSTELYRQPNSPIFNDTITSPFSHGGFRMQQERTANPVVYKSSAETGEAPGRTPNTAALHQSGVYGRVARQRPLWEKGKWPKTPIQVCTGCGDLPKNSQSGNG